MSTSTTTDANAFTATDREPDQIITEKERMLKGELYYAFEPQLDRERARAAAACWEFNNAGPEVSRLRRVEMQNRILGLPPPPPTASAHSLTHDYPHILPPFTCDYGTNLAISGGTFINFSCTLLDTCKIIIGPRVLIGPNVSFYAATHPIDPRVRNGFMGPELGREIVVEEDVWIGGGVVVCPGVRIGRGSTVAAGSVVVKDVQPYTVVGGNPARFLKAVPMDQPPVEVHPRSSVRTEE